jgi:hypothetical protein
MQVGKLGQESSSEAGGGEQEWGCMYDWKTTNNMDKKVIFQIMIKGLHKL